jgi:hypothetical protein
MSSDDSKSEADRTQLNFMGEVRNKFAFLVELGFSEVEAGPTLVRFRRGVLEVDLYHERQSYEIDAGITYLGERYAMEHIIRAVDAEASERYHIWQSSTREGVATGLAELSSLMKRHCCPALRGDEQFFLTVKQQREVSWAAYLDKMDAAQVRPKADDAFHRKDYAAAADLFARIRNQLSPAELKKLEYAEKHRNG